MFATMLMARMFTAQEPETMEYKIWKTNNGISFSNKKKKKKESSSCERTQRNLKHMK